MVAGDGDSGTDECSNLTVTRIHHEKHRLDKLVCQITEELEAVSRKYQPKMSHRLDLLEVLM